MEKNRHIVVKMVLFFLILFGIGVLLQLHINRISAKREVNLDDSWQISIDGTQYDDVRLSEFHMPATKRGTEVILKRILPEEYYSQTSLRMLIRYCAVQISIDHNMIFEKGMEAYSKNDILGSGYIWASLPEGYEGKEIEIRLLTGEKNSFSSVNSIMLVDSTYGIRWLVLNNITTIAIAVFLMILGLLLLVSTGIIAGGDKRFHLLLYIGLFSLTIACWMIYNSRLIEVISNCFTVNVRIEYVSMYLAAIFLVMFIAEFMKKPAQKRWLHCEALFFVFLLLVLGYLNESNIIHYCKTGFIFQLSVFAAIIPVIVELIVMVRRLHLKAERSVLLGIVFFVTAVILELVRYRYNKICIPEYQLTQSFVPIGTLMFILLMLEAFCVIMMQRAVEDIEREKLYEMAYRDALTDLKNRAWCEKIMQEYQNSHKPVSIINIDLNYFKHVNDTYGHAKGDELLIDFAEILKEAFPQPACVGRMGGDEFIVILDYEIEEELEAKIQNLKKVVTERNQKSAEDKQISFAFGYASNENDKTLSVWKVYEAADHKMYEYKQKYKLTR
ncbi:GGDEF domain-containing protein [Roseburia sp. MUC/MUC-530-WT-4D]|uniref:GGDEF domain-containing protein n=1 Tax=Roseburia porci TaxID=2605790 RepID=A0A6L5YSA3_9FIRM|nr:GGDEF domain-containing protein [Roseburia porci]MST75354.1 GGDEF domain-containing protein [Roseburia porci]